LRKVTVRFTLNGKEVKVRTYPSRRLVDLLREDLGLTGTKIGCEIGECGACTVIFNGRAVNSCLVLAPEVDGGEVLTVEGLSGNGELHPIQKAFIEHDAVHCGFCTPGFLLVTYALLKENSNPTEEEIRDAISGNLCRCTGYIPIIEAIKSLVKGS
jgi:carbon-monoxide dehydrogenase small subunit